MIIPPARILGVHGLAGPVDPWVADGLSIRILMHPRLGFALGPLAVSVRDIGELDLPSATFKGSGPGWRGGGDIDGVAWLRLDQPVGEGRPPILAQLDGNFDPDVRISVVRHPTDLTAGISTRHAEPYVLSAPDVRTLRVEGRCHISRIGVARAEIELAGSNNDIAVGLPLGVIASDGAHPEYLGFDPGGDLAFERVRRGAPLQHGPHEGKTPAAELANADLARDAEQARVKELVLGGQGIPLAQQLEDMVSLSRPERLLPVRIADLIVDSPKATIGTRSSLESILAASGDPGIARWMGLASVIDLPPGATVVAVTVAGRWMLPHDAWSEWVGSFEDRSSVEQLLGSVPAGPQGQLLSDQLHPGVFEDELYVSASLWAQALIDTRAPADPPAAPSVALAAPGVWSFAPGGDVVRLPLTFGGCVPIAQAGLVRLRPDGPAPTQPPIEGLPERSRPLLVSEGTGVDLLIEDPADDGSYPIEAWQADMFGRWSDGTGEIDIAGPPRPGLPTPDARWSHVPDQPVPDGEGLFVPRISVRVGVPPRIPGQPEIETVRARLDSGSDSTKPADPPSAAFDLAGAGLGRAQVSPDSLVVSFTGAYGSVVEAAPVPISFVDPRPPLPPPRPPVLRFADRPDASGRAGFHVELPAGAGIDAWRIFLTTESRLRRTAAADGLAPPDPSLSRDERAAEWLAQSSKLRRGHFDCLTSSPVGGTAWFHATLPGSLSDVAFVRAVPQRRGGVEPDFATCPVMAFAVPFAMTPASPVVSLDRSVSPPIIRIRARPGAIEPAGYRMRLGTSPLDDARTAVVVAEGALVDGVADVAAPRLLPFASAYAVVEVIGEPETGLEPRPALWSAPSTPIQLLEVPAAAPPPTMAPTATVDGALLTVTVAVPGLPAKSVPEPFRVRLYRRAAVDAPWEFGPEAEVTHGSAQLSIPHASVVACQVTLVDPLGRTSAPVTVVLP